MTGKEGLWKRIRKPLENVVLISELICVILGFFFGKTFLELVRLLCIIYLLLISMRLIDERHEQFMEAYEARTKLIRAKWMFNEVKDMVKDKGYSRDDVIEFIEKMSEDFEI
jgi:hypothetical protein